MSSCYLFGDSSSIAHYLRWLGYRMPQLEQSGSNFGVETKHESPYLCTVGRGTMVSDGLSLMNAEYSAHLVPPGARLGRQTQLPGQQHRLPAPRTAGENVLLGTKAMVPLDGEVRQNVGLLGSPCFEIPRSVDRDSAFDGLKTPDQRHDRLG